MPQLLLSAGALTMPRVQVIVLNADMRCLECRDRVSKVLARMDNLLDYGVNGLEKKVTVRGRVDTKKIVQRIRLMANHEKRRKTIERLGGEEQYNYSCSSRWKVKLAYNYVIQQASCSCCA